MTLSIVLHVLNYRYLSVAISYLPVMKVWIRPQHNLIFEFVIDFTQRIGNGNFISVYVQFPHMKFAVRISKQFLNIIDTMYHIVL